MQCVQKQVVHIYRECVAIDKLQGAHVTKLYKCTKVVNNKCTQNSGDKDIVAVRFDYAFKKPINKKKSSQWILNTAYLSEYSNCQ